MNREIKLAHVAAGGGLSAAYYAGVAYYMGKAGFPRPDVEISGSGSVGTSSYKASGQIESIRRIWCDRLAQEKFVKPSRLWKILDTDFLIDDIFGKQEVLDYSALSNSDIHLFAAVTNSKTGELKHFSNRERVYWSEVMRAAKTMPVAYNLPFWDRSVLINGERYCDSRVSSRTTLNVLKAIKLGSKKIVVFDNYPLNATRSSDKIPYYIWLMSKSREFRRNHTEQVEIQDSGPKIAEPILFFRPKELVMSYLDNRRASLEKTFDQGYADAKNSDDLKRFHWT